MLTVGNRITESLVLGATKNEVRGRVSRANWLKDFTTKATIIGECETSGVLPQAMAAHLVLIGDKIHLTHYPMARLTQNYVKGLRNLGIEFEDKLQESLFAIAMYHHPTEVRDAVRRSRDHEIRLGKEPTNFKNWMFVQDFLFVDMQDTMKVKPILRLMYTLIEIMSAIADEFPDDLSPRHRITG